MKHTSYYVLGTFACMDCLLLLAALSASSLASTTNLVVISGGWNPIDAKKSDDLEWFRQTYTSTAQPASVGSNILPGEFPPPRTAA